jgi:putative FmdB family regulatory protein
MPIYEYECGKGHVFEKMVSINGPEPSTCEMDGCRSKPKRLISASGFILKGSGWYSSDYPSASRQQAMDAEAKAANGGGDGGGHTCGSGCGHGAPNAAEASTDAIGKELKKSASTNPYKAGKKKSKSSAKAKS